MLISCVQSAPKGWILTNLNIQNPCTWHSSLETRLCIQVSISHPEIVRMAKTIFSHPYSTTDKGRVWMKILQHDRQAKCIMTQCFKSCSWSSIQCQRAHLGNCSGSSLRVSYQTLSEKPKVFSGSHNIPELASIPDMECYLRDMLKFCRWKSDNFKASVEGIWFACWIIIQFLFTKINFFY